MGLFRHKCSKCGAWCTWISSDMGLGGYGWWCPNCAEREELRERIRKLEQRLR